MEETRFEAVSPGIGIPMLTLQGKCLLSQAKAANSSGHLLHTASTLMQSLGVSPKAVQEMLGHSQLTQTGDYSHVIFSMQQQASERMDILFQKPS